MTISKVLRDMGLSDTVHGFRSAFKDWASEASSFPDAVSEAALAHSDRDKTRAAYKRTVFLNMRVNMMAAWATFVEQASDEIGALRMLGVAKLNGKLDAISCEFKTDVRLAPNSRHSAS